jgi:hypothetical protein
MADMESLVIFTASSSNASVIFILSSFLFSQSEKGIFFVLDFKRNSERRIKVIGKGMHGIYLYLWENNTLQ